MWYYFLGCKEESGEMFPEVIAEDRPGTYISIA